MNRHAKLLGIALVGAVLVGRGAVAQEPPAQEPAKPLEIGAVAPDFELPGATRYGILREPVRLSDFKGKTVVLAFFFKARTKG
jgi:peroxiredoxin Q/BCP